MHSELFISLKAVMHLVVGHPHFESYQSLIHSYACKIHIKNDLRHINVLWVGFVNAHEQNQRYLNRADMVLKSAFFFYFKWLVSVFRPRKNVNQ